MPQPPARPSCRALAALLLAAACAQTAAPHTRYPYFLEAGRDAPAPPQQLFLAPLHFGRSMPDPLAEGLPVLAHELARYLEQAGHRTFTLGTGEFARAWATSALRVGGLTLGSIELMQERYAAAIRDLLSRLERQGMGPFDAMLVPHVAFRNVEFLGTGARWDGVYRRMSFRNRPQRFMVDHLAGHTTALSLHVEVYSRAGERFFESYGGLSLAYRIDLEAGENRPQLREDALSHVGQLREGIALALHPYVALGAGF